MSAAVQALSEHGPRPIIQPAFQKNVACNAKVCLFKDSILKIMKRNFFSRVDFVKIFAFNFS